MTMRGAVGLVAGAVMTCGAAPAVAAEGDPAPCDVSRPPQFSVVAPTRLAVDRQAVFSTHPMQTVIGSMGMRPFSRLSRAAA